MRNFMWNVGMWMQLVERGDPSMWACVNAVQYSTAIVHLFKLKMEMHKFVQRKGKKRRDKDAKLEANQRHVINNASSNTAV